MVKRILKENIIAKLLNKYRKFIYVDPTTFKGLLDYEKNKLVDYKYVEKRLKPSNSFFVYTNQVMAPQFADKFIEFDEKTAGIIKHLEWTYFEIIYPESHNISFNRKLGILKIGESELKVNPDKEPAKICAVFFVSKQYIKKEMDWDEISEKILDSNAIGDLDNVMKLKVFRLNKRISKKFGYTNLIIYKSKTLFVNPNYHYLFK